MKLKTLISENADKCVKCGLCLPHCPTYLETYNECESPRGRISLIAGVTQQSIPATEKLNQYIDHCLQCRACEAMCPANVPYGQLMDDYKALSKNQTTNKRLSIQQIFFNGFTQQHHFKQILFLMTWLLQKLGVFWLIKRLYLLKTTRLYHAIRLLPSLKLTLPHKSKTLSAQKPTVLLYPGCTGDFFEQDVLKQATELLELIGYNVYCPPQPSCCGAIHLHNGDRQTAVNLAKKNIAVFSETAPVVIIALATGCGSTLSEYKTLIADTDSKALNTPVVDFAQFFLRHMPSNLTFNPLNKVIYYQLPCSLSHVLRDKHSLKELLQKIPGIELEPLPNETLCCGASGVHMLTDSTHANKMLKQKIGEHTFAEHASLVSPNIGCRLHIGAYLKENHPTVDAIHPISLLYQSIFAQNKS